MLREEWDASVIAGRRIANEYLALGTLFSTGVLTYGSTKVFGGGSKKKEEPKTLVDKAKSTLGIDGS